MSLLLIFLDATILIAALASAIFWKKASVRRGLRRVSRFEALDHADFNRLVIALTRAQILNARAAMATSLAAVLATIRLAVDLL